MNDVVEAHDMAAKLRSRSFCHCCVNCSLYLEQSPIYADGNLLKE